jgi:hypothetical protein
MLRGQKHLIECHCILPQYRRASNTVYHKFVVFSVIDSSDTVVPKFTQCNNCGVIHKVYDVCKSEIITHKEDLKSIKTIDDLALTLPTDVSRVLASYNCDLPSWEYAEFILNNEAWGSIITLTRDEADDEITGKALQIEGRSQISIITY